MGVCMGRQPSGVASRAVFRYPAGGPLALARAGWLALAACTLGLLIASVPAAFADLRVPCTPGDCQLDQLMPAGMGMLRRLGWTPTAYASYLLALHTLFALVWGGVGALLAWRKGDDRAALLTALTLLIFGIVSFTSICQYLVREHPLWGAPVRCLELLGAMGFISFVYLFPVWRFVPGWTGWSALAGLPLIGLLYDAGHPDRASPWLLTLEAALSVAVVGGALYGQGYRYRRVLNRAGRQQAKWVVYGIAVALSVYTSGSVLMATALAAPSTPEGMAALLAVQAANHFAMLLIPLAIGIAMLRHRLFDVDLLINRTLVYGALTACVAVLYVALVALSGRLLQGAGSPTVALPATGAVAILFHPLRAWLQRRVDRLLYGQRHEPYAVLSRLGQRLEATLAPEALLPTVAETAAQALKLPYAAVALLHGGQLTIAARWGDPVTGLLRLPLSYAGELLGELQLAPRAPGDPFSVADRQLLDDLARQAGIAAHAVHLTAELRALNRDLHRSRAELIAAREEERRRLRRDLHDGLGSALTAMTLKLGAVQNLQGRDPETVGRLLGELRAELQGAIGDIRHLAYDLRPPILDELGLASALREHTARHDAGPMHVTVESPASLSDLPAAIELAAYRIATEALANAGRHARARTCRIVLRADVAEFSVTIADDGVGLPAGYRAGVGILGMRERAAELGGTCIVEASPAGGTRVRASWPMTEG